MNFNERPETKALVSRLEDIISVRDRGELGVSQFLTPKELHISEEYLKAKGVSYVKYGGYEAFERGRIYLLPDYMEELSTAESDVDFEEKISEYGYSANITILKIKASGYRRLTHRDFLGSVLGLGVERSVMGDIVLLNDGGSEALIICDSTIGEFFLRELSFVANDKVKISIADKREISFPEKRTAPIHDTVAAPRLDAVVAALCGLSRDKARTAVESGLAELDFEREERPDKTVTSPAIISVRGYGRYKINSLSDKTRKGRYRLDAEKYV